MTKFRERTHRDDIRPIRVILDRDFVASRMNNTKWHEVAQALGSLPLSFYIKFVDDEEVHEMHRFWSVTQAWLDSAFPGPFLALAIEWLDIDPVQQIARGRLVAPKTIDHMPEVLKRLQEINVPFEQSEAYIRIIGHVRKTSNS